VEKKTKLEVVLDGVELLVGVGVSTLVGGALVLVKPANLGLVKKAAVGLGGMAISWMASDKVVAYIDDQVKTTVQQIKDKMKKKKPEEKTVEGEVEAT
jgi:hypothetical protein